MALEDAAVASSPEGSPPVSRSETPAAVEEIESGQGGSGRAESGEAESGRVESGQAEPETARDPQEEELEEELDEEIAEETEEHERHVHTGPAKGWFFVSIILTLLLAVLVGANTDSALIYTVAGFLPTVVCIVIFIALLDGQFKDVLFWLTPLAVCLLFLAVGPWANVMLDNQLDIPSLTAVNLIISYLILFVGQGLEYFSSLRSERVVLENVEDFSPEHLDKYIHTIEDKCKAINFVIGRVYRESRGGTKALREKIKIPSEWYNEFNDITVNDLKEKKEFALLLLQKIEAQLKTLLMPEKDVFTLDEVRRLDIAHDANGYDRIIDVLAVNDRDPVEDYFLGAMDFCKKVSEGLRRM
ncbi:hypothetical protein D6789_02535 [Candidatus Woesearchaeota archaeon]|nr:MAG: hypothetical protein D6789_02535 [Candidatus Woesearchaeota archaeon]